MASKVFLDANLILDAYLQRAGWSDAQQIIRMAHEGIIVACTTPAVLHICSYFLCRTHQEIHVRKLLSALLQDVYIIELSHKEAVKALASAIPDIEDALQYYAALQHGLDVFLTSDKRLQKSALPELLVISPADFLK